MPLPSLNQGAGLTFAGGVDGTETGTFGSIATAGSNRCAYLAFTGYNYFTATPRFLYGGVPMELAANSPGGINDIDLKLFRFVDPPLASTAITWDSYNNAGYWGSAVAFSLKDVNQSTPDENPQLANIEAATSTFQVTSIPDDQRLIVIAVLEIRGSDIDIASPGIDAGHYNLGNLNSDGGVQAPTVPTTTVTVNGAFTGRAVTVQALPVATPPPAGGGGSPSIDLGSMGGFEIRFRLPRRRPQIGDNPGRHLTAHDRLLFHSTRRGGV